MVKSDRYPEQIEKFCSVHQITTITTNRSKEEHTFIINFSYPGIESLSKILLELK